MAIITIRTGRILGDIHRDMLKMVGDVFKTAGMMQPNRAWVPAVDIYETEKEVVVLVDAAGIKQESLDITLYNDLLRIAGLREDESSSRSRKFYQMEIAYGAFERVLRLPSVVESDGAAASYKNGLLSIILPKIRKTYRVEIA
ncbi:MAG: Hsp20/alpha crystallin family protein [Deltaproteobacteria bacterium]|nr:Hsp20/alpha crystallin family protein [Deltaproteobacteria bacterium]